ncbi:hypothetical protein CcCBS67573_g09573 [Chytriomyces confervae]|uniref:Arf3-interacting protein 1 N-terminal domain-containing protein n=1 Tax=Chytriomyces confervae TaxID=246404 RepID=A0A507DRX0_9FUNG|nr:hypothetical protein CcCBS67573_g09573 [Chytriomyces confervae]
MQIPASAVRIDRTKVLGKGSFGIVYAATYNSRSVAVKCLVGMDTVVARRLERGAQLLYRTAKAVLKQRCAHLAFVKKLLHPLLLGLFSDSESGDVKAAACDEAIGALYCENHPHRVGGRLQAIRRVSRLDHALYRSHGAVGRLFSSIMINVSYILISEWVNGSPQVKFQFPNAQTHSTHENIAPLMLPFGCELRLEDSFIFVLHAKNQNRDSLPDSESTVLKLRKFDSKTLGFEAFSFDGRVWKPLSSSSSLIQLAPNSETIWDSDCLRTFAEINLESKAEYRQPERDCVVVYSEASIFGLRFNSEYDKICFVNHLDSALKLGKNYSANRSALPAIPLDPFAHLPSLFCQTVVRNTNSKIRSLTIASWICAFGPLVTLALCDFMMNEKIGIVTSLFQAINSLDLSTMPQLTYSE